MLHDISRLAYRLPFENGMEGREKVFAGKEVSTTLFGGLQKNDCRLTLEMHTSGQFWTPPGFGAFGELLSSIVVDHFEWR